MTQVLASNEAECIQRHEQVLKSFEGAACLSKDCGQAQW